MWHRVSVTTDDLLPTPNDNERIVSCGVSILVMSVSLVAPRSDNDADVCPDCLKISTIPGWTYAWMAE